MRKSNVMIAILSTAAAAVSAPAHAEPKSNEQEPPFTLDYHLPEVKITFGVSYRITTCPRGDTNDLSGFAMDTVTAITPSYFRGTKIRINPKGNLFVDRAIKLENHENGTLKSFNGSSTGQGGKIVAAAIKAVSFVGALTVGVPPVAAGFIKSSSAVIKCKDEIAQLINQRNELEKELDGLRKALSSGNASESQLDRIARTEKAIDATNERLTISLKPVVWTPGTDQNLPQQLAPANLSDWFDYRDSNDLKLAFEAIGLGQMLQFTARANYVTKLDAAATTPRSGQQKIYRALVYREPGSVDAILEPSDPNFNPGQLKDVEAARAFAAYKEATVKKTVPAPQIGPLKIIPFDGSGIFGSRAVTATFAETGELTSIGYTSTGGADALAGVIDAGVAAGIEQRDAQTNALKRAVERRTQADALKALNDAQAKAKKEEEERNAPPGS
ncbi:hypothetical protein GCM10009424_09500 [Sphingomonas ursincola]|uniref:Uncharacterized protein n=1 Tax=Sphingomonas ursincola TaxID=56361 RepID=A0A7V8U956_9SPHN|nr:hypothetical protein [Sphingomonas ursincola]MBA1375065.1 hypothetical protein [Sphingomonas ursincola]